jgi:lipopolysaccharide cholinephosphotransferase
MTDKELKKLQNKILEIVEYFDNFCKENGIVYYLMGGSALGAMRHQGFIPWDDDFDVFMDRKNYLKFLALAEEKIDKEKFYVQKENSGEYPLYFNKLRMNGTTFIEEEIQNRKIHHGIYIDIMCLNNTSKNLIIRYVQYLSARILNTRALAEQGYSTKSKFKLFALKISKYIVNDFSKMILLKIVRGLNNQHTDMIGHFFGRAPFRKTSFPVHYLGQQRYVKFENLKLPVPSNVEEYLTIRYGKTYMELPSEAVKAQYPSHAFIVDTEKSYECYRGISCDS